MYVTTNSIHHAQVRTHSAYRTHIVIYIYHICVCMCVNVTVIHVRVLVQLRHQGLNVACVLTKVLTVQIGSQNRVRNSTPLQMCNTVVWYQYIEGVTIVGSLDTLISLTNISYQLQIPLSYHMTMGVRLAIEISPMCCLITDPLAYTLSYTNKSGAPFPAFFLL